MAATYIETATGIHRSIPAIGERWREKASECFWCSVCLGLFMILGPFAAPIALGFVLSSHAEGVDVNEPHVAE